jgi:putative oxygen-independent coproporphyrinogen III oxidase
MHELGLYVHFPWCVRKCPYCDFNSHPLRGALDFDGYRDALLKDMAAALADVTPGRITSVFFGGGTPSLFPPSVFRALLARLGPLLAPDAEITLEANPGTTEHHDPAGYLAAGINRLSFGAQTFDDRQLQRLGRIHGAAETRAAVATARRAGFTRVNLDIMYALPQQTAAAALADLEAALALAPEHLSWYQLTLEPKTEFARRPPPLPGELAVTRMEALGHERLAAAGFERYEISAYGRNGDRCRHNLNYWSFGDYVGIGAGAHGKRTRYGKDQPPAVLRTRKAAQPRLYLAEPTRTHSVTVPSDQLAFEFLMNALRLIDGVAFDRFGAATGLDFEALQPAWQRGVESGLLRADRLAATPLGLRHLDGLLQGFLT